MIGQEGVNLFDVGFLDKNFKGLPAGMSTNSRGDLFVCDPDAHRVVGVFRNRLVAGAKVSFDFVIGQPDLLSSGLVRVSSTTLNSPRDVVFDQYDNILIADSGNNSSSFSRQAACRRTTLLLLDLLLGSPALIQTYKEHPCQVRDEKEKWRVEFFDELRAHISDVFGHGCLPIVVRVGQWK